MKKKYVEPRVGFVQTRVSGAVADVCWAYGRNNKVFYYNTSGPGYVQIIMNRGSGCDGSTIGTLQWWNPATGAYEAATTEQWAEVQAGVDMAPGNSAEPFKGSPFSASIDPSWS